MLYKHQWIFDEEPLSLSTWETQEQDHGMSGWHTPYSADVTYRASSPVEMEVTAFDQQGMPTMRTYGLSPTSGGKRKLYVPFFASKGVLYKYRFRSPAQDFYLYREESSVLVSPWGSGEMPVPVRPFGNDDRDQSRSMMSSSLAAARSGGA